MHNLKQSSQSGPGHPEYEFIIEDQFDAEQATETGRRKGRRSHIHRPQSALVARLFITVLALLCTFVVLVLLYTNSSPGQSRAASPAAPTHLGTSGNFNMKQNWGAYSPYFDTGRHFEGISQDSQDGLNSFPATCSLKRVHLLHRHGDRYPAGSTSKRMREVALKLKDMAEEPTNDDFHWLKRWNYTLDAENLVGAGVGAMFTSGAKFWGSHGRHLYNQSEAPAWSDKFTAKKPLIWSTTQNRMQDSARAWAAGFFGEFARPATDGHSQDHYKLYLQPEEAHQNSSLASYFACPNAEKKGANTGQKRQDEWVATYLADAAVRLQQELPGYKNLSADEVLSIQDLCVFETAAYGSSGFCSWFTDVEWRGFEYHTDLKFYGDAGWGSHTAPATGLPWLRELLARFRKEYLTEPGYGVNTTVAGSSELFPLDQPFYADFTHDTVITSILAALQFDWLKPELPSDHIEAPRQFIVSRLTPFAARLMIEVLSCDKGEFVRIKLNDRVLPLGSLKYCKDNKLGLCASNGFVKSVEWALEAIDYDEVCFGEPDFLIKGDV